MSDNPNRKVINAWCMYDWANSAFACTIMGAMFPPFYRSMVKGAGLSEAQATAYWGYTASAALLLVALIAPVLGAVSDYTGGKKRYVAFFAGLGVLCTACFFFLGSDTWLMGSLLFIGGNIGFAGANIFYESLLPHIAGENNIDRVSTRGYALGYVGGGILLVINVLWFTHPEWFFMPDQGFAVRAGFFSVAVWWGAFSVPFFRHVPEPAAAREPGPARSPLSQGFRRLGVTFREIRRYKQLLLFLAAFWIYNDGIGTIIKMATAYGDEIGIGMTHLIGALIMVQFVGIPFAFLFGFLAGKIGAKSSILLALGVYTVTCIFGFFMKTALHFYLLAFMVAMVQGGSQGLSRSLYGVMVPKHKSAEFFGFFSTSSKFAGIFGPLLFGLVSQAFGQSRLSIVALIVFFIFGGLLLSLVDVNQAVQTARAEEAEYARAPGRA